MNDFKAAWFAAILLLAAASPSAAQDADTAVVYRFPASEFPPRQAPAAAMAAELEAEGERYEARRAVLWVPAGGMEPARAQALVDTLDRIVAAVEGLIGGAAPWQRWEHPRVRYYAYPESFISQAASGARVFVALERARTATAPWVHETVHAVYAPHRDSLWDAATGPADILSLLDTELMWLHEGLASAVAEMVSERHGITDFNPLEGAPVSPAHDRCRAYLAAPAGQAILPYLGETGRPAELMGPRRQELAPAFYACAQSLARWLVGRHGVPAVAALLNASDGRAALVRLTGGHSGAPREAWLAWLRS